jgi:hypothetical protein
LSLSFIPHPGQRELWGMWLGGTQASIAVADERFGTLLGPERTPCFVGGGFSWWAAPGLDRLTHSLVLWVGVVVVVVGSGCGGVLSVA